MKKRKKNIGMKIFVDMIHKKSEQQVINMQNSKIIDIFLRLK